MARITKYHAAIAAAVVTITALGAQCGGGSNQWAQGPADVGCAVTADWPHPSNGSPDWIVGKVRVVCSSAIDSLQIYAKLQKQVNNQWVNADSPPPKDIDKPAANQKYTYQAQVPCSPIATVFRTAGKASGSLAGKTAGGDWKYSAEKSVSC